jgi:hypothetical protein
VRKGRCSSCCSSNWLTCVERAEHPFNTPADGAGSAQRLVLHWQETHCHIREVFMSQPVFALPCVALHNGLHSAKHLVTDCLTYLHR